MLDVYADFCQNHMAMPVIQGEKSAAERFPGAVSTLTIEAMVQDRKALQAGTSHFLGQNFSRAQGIRFQDQNGQEQYAWTTSWGVTTRLIGALVMSHSDDDGVVLPPRLAPKHIVIMPIFRNDQERSTVMEYCQKLKKELDAHDFADRKIEVLLDDRDIRGGEKNWYHVKRGVPIRLEIGPRDVAADAVSLARRDRGVKERASAPRSEFTATATQILADIQNQLLERAERLRREHTRNIDTLDDFRAFFTPKDSEKPEIHGGFALCHWSDDPAADRILADLKVTNRCLPLDADQETGRCIVTGRPSPRRAVFAKAY